MNRGRGRRERGARRAPAPWETPRPAPHASGAPARPTSARDAHPVAGRALLPLRLFLGATFLYAGFDKLLSPGFFVASAPGSIQEQLAVFARHSPLGGLIAVAQPFAVEIGILIAVAEVAIGLGALSGFGFRLASVGGAALSLLFWLTASWTTRPYYYGPDLPYAAGWITLALAGHGGLLASRRIAAWAPAAPQAASSSTGPTIARRTFLEAALLGTAAVAVASLAVPLRLLGIEGSGSALGAAGGAGRGTGSPTPTPAVGSAGPSPTPTDDAGSGAGNPSPTPTGPPGTAPPGVVVATTADLAATGAVAFTVPFDAPAPLPAGDPAVIVKVSGGTYVAFDTVCTHAGCTVEWDRPDRLLVCPCHGAVFDPAHGGRVVEGPTDQPLAQLPLVLDAASGTFMLKAG